MRCRRAFHSWFPPIRAAIAIAMLSSSLVEPAPRTARCEDSGNRSGGPHWAYSPPIPTTPPAIRDAAWTRQPLDAFIASRLEAEHLQPAAEADRITLIRRLSFDLTGLPPTLEAVDAFVRDSSPDAYERLVDRLLSSPLYGERMAVAWLDLARYADTHGYHSDSQREMWRWRDWVVDALNSGMPYDQFTLEQLAGDLLPDATLEQRLATGFHRNHMLNDENGAIPEEYLAEYVAERAATTATVWLGQTLACARCHDHKHDPFTQRDFFQLYAFFNSVPENGLGGRNGNSPPVLSVPTPTQAAELKQITDRMTSIGQQLAARRTSPSLEQDFVRWESQWARDTETAAQPPDDAVSILRFDEESGITAANSAAADLPGKLHGNPSWVEGKHGKALLCDGQTYVEMKLPVGAEISAPFTLTAWVFPTTGDKLPIVSRLDETQYRRGFEWGIDKRSLYFSLTHKSGENELSIRAISPVATSRWQLMAVTYDGGGRAEGVRLFLDGKPVELEVVHDSLSKHVSTDQLLHIGRGDTSSFFRGMLDEVQVFDRSLSADEVSRLAGGDPLRDIARMPRANRTAAQQAALHSYFLNNVDPIYGQLLTEQRKLERRHATVQREAPSVMVLAEMATPRPTHVHLGGRYDLLGEQVLADVPQSLPPMSKDAPRNRLGLARWLVARDNPLTARVAVNRQWQILFGAGLVRTPDDFGLLGERPSHPELLDSLACELQNHGWDIKRLHRQFVTSATYRQSSIAPEEVLRHDPANRLLARSTRQRLSAEMLRDAALQAAGQLQGTFGGPAVRPYQPAELWSELAYNAVDYKAQVFEQSRGADLYRRSLYTFWKRSVPPPNLALLDAPDRELCTVDRATTESPLQALVLLNDTTFVEAARLLAESAMTSGRSDVSGRIDFIFRRVVSRRPTPAEASLLRNFWQRQQARYAADPAAADALLGVGASPARQGLSRPELAAGTNVALTVLNLDEALTRN